MLGTLGKPQTNNKGESVKTSGRSTSSRGRTVFIDKGTVYDKTRDMGTPVLTQVSQRFPHTLRKACSVRRSNQSSFYNTRSHVIAKSDVETCVHVFTNMKN